MVDNGACADGGGPIICPLGPPTELEDRFANRYIETQWTIVIGTWQEAAGVRCTATGAGTIGGMLLWEHVSTGNVRASLTLDSLSDGVGVMLRADATRSGYALMIGGGGTQVELYEFTNDTGTLLAFAVPLGGINAGDTLQLECNGTTLNAGVNGLTDIVGIVDATHSTGAAAIIVGRSGDTMAAITVTEF